MAEPVVLALGKYNIFHILWNVKSRIYLFFPTAFFSATQNEYFGKTQHSLHLYTPCNNKTSVPTVTLSLPISHAIVLFLLCDLTSSPLVSSYSTSPSSSSPSVALTGLAKQRSCPSAPGDLASKESHVSRRSVFCTAGSHFRTLDPPLLSRILGSSTFPFEISGDKICSDKKESDNVAMRDENPSTRDFSVDGGNAGGGGECTTRICRMRGHVESMRRSDEEGIVERRRLDTHGSSLAIFLPLLEKEERGVVGWGVFMQSEG